MQLNGKRSKGLPCATLRQVVASGKVSACKVRDLLLSIEQLSNPCPDGWLEKSIAQATEAVSNLETDLDGLLNLLEEKQPKL